MKFLKAFLVVLFVSLLLAFVGCSGFQDILTPCHISKDVLEYSGQEATSYMFFTSVWDAKRIRAYVNFNHIQYQNACERLKQDDSLTHAFLLDSVDTNIADSVQLQKTIFNPTGPIGALLLAGSGLGIGAIAIKRPGDKSKKQTAELVKIMSA